MKCTEEQFEALKNDTRYRDIGVLPSQFIPYSSKHLDKLGEPYAVVPRMDQMFIRPFELADFKLLSQSIELKRYAYLIRAINNVISYPAEWLTIGDFYYVLAWLRIYSMPKRPYTFEWKCTMPYYRHKVTRVPLNYAQETWPSTDELKEEYEASVCDTDNISITEWTDLQTKVLAEDLELPEGFDFPRVNIYEDTIVSLQDAELAQLVPAVQWIAGPTWAEKLARANASFEDFQIGLDLNDVVDHGIVENVAFSCRQCRVRHIQPLALSAFSFFR